MQSVQYAMGMRSLQSPLKVRSYVLDWFRYLMDEQGINANDVLYGKFMLTLRHNSDEVPNSYETLYSEIAGWAKHEFNIDLKLAVCHDQTAYFNQFDFVAAVRYSNNTD